MAIDPGQPEPRKEWPFGCRYHEPWTMDAVQISALLTRDTIYAKERTQWKLDCLYVSDGKVCELQTAMHDAHDQGIFGQTVVESPMSIVYVEQYRVYLSHKTASSLAIDERTWMTLLNQFEILPSFLELLHSNNGGSLVHVSHYGGTSTREGAQSSYEQPAAFHLGYKTGNWQNDEAAVYARKNLTTGRSFILVLGTRSCFDLSRVQRLLQCATEVNIFHIVHTLHSIGYDAVEGERWLADFRVQDLEFQTGIATFQNPFVRPKDPAQMKYNEDLSVTDDLLRNIGWGSARVLLNFKALQEHLLRYQKACEDLPACRMSDAVIQSLQSACQMKTELAQSQQNQIHELRARVSAQVNVTNALMAQHHTKLSFEIAEAAREDSELNIEIAKAAKRDSELMRGIAVVTMIFLPATFVATFFSMVFFHVGDERSIHLTVDHRIWLYPAVAVPLSLVIAAWYVPWSLGVSWRSTLRAAVEKKAADKRHQIQSSSDHVSGNEGQVGSV